MAFLQGELAFWQESGLMDARLASRIEAQYSVKDRGFAQILLCAGAVLLGLGALCAIAANWSDIPRAARLALIVGAYLVALLVSWRCQVSLPRTSRSLLLLAGLIFGGGIFLTAQMFHQDGHWSTAFGWWAGGLLPTVVLFGDPWQLILVQVLTGGYLGGLDLLFWSGSKALWQWYLIPAILLVVLWGLWIALDRPESAFHMNVMLSAFFVFTRLADTQPLCVVLAVFFVMGIVMMIASGGTADWQFSLSVWGTVFCGVAGLALSLPDVWQGFSAPMDLTAKQLAAASAAIMALVMIARLYRGAGMAGIFLGLLVLRYFADKLFGFLSKAAGFSTLGVLCLVAGFVWERRMRRRRARQRQDRGVSDHV